MTVIRGEARIRLVDTRIIEETRQIHPHWPFEELQLLTWQRGLELDTGWQKNTVTDQARIGVAAGTSFGTSLDIFIHQNTHPSLVSSAYLHNVYANQTPAQIRTPDTSVFDTAALLQTRTVQFPAPSVARNINIAGLVNVLSITQNAVYAIWAQTLLSSTVTQGTTQAADVQYRVTFSLD